MPVSVACVWVSTVHSVLRGDGVERQWKGNTNHNRVRVQQANVLLSALSAPLVPLPSYYFLGRFRQFVAGQGGGRLQHGCFPPLSGDALCVPDITRYVSSPSQAAVRKPSATIDGRCHGVVGGLLCEKDGWRVARRMVRCQLRRWSTSPFAEELQ